MKRSQGRSSCQEPGNRNQSRGHKETLLTGFLLMACSACFLIQPISQENTPTDLPIVQSAGGNFSVEISHPQMNLAYVKLTKLINLHSDPNLYMALLLLCGRCGVWEAALVLHGEIGRAHV